LREFPLFGKRVPETDAAPRVPSGFVKQEEAEVNPAVMQAVLIYIMVRPPQPGAETVNRSGKHLISDTLPSVPVKPVI